MRLLLNTYLVTSNTDGILALEAYLARRKPPLVGRFSLPFGIPHLLARDPKDAEAFFRSLLTSPKLADRDWVAWNHAFSLLQMKSPDEAKAELTGLAERVTEPVLLLLSLYLLDVVARNDATLETRVGGMRDRLAADQTPETFQQAIEKSSGNMQVVVLSKLIRDAVQWLFAGPRPEANVSAP